ncbi:hypothetical protein AB0M28_00310 [Streptomyces sp. NPDC051940]|uniref:hypothetical protein n=1 Tax=Streptomyces sp. NPDC051940 TaxID=3155675 RepID=UPI003424EF1A
MTERKSPADIPAQRGVGNTSGLDTPGLDEDALRGLLRGAVDDLAPNPGALDHLRYAVPARRARKRQLVVGAAALAVLAVASVPALVRSGAIIDGGDKPVTASSNHATPSSGSTTGVDDGQEGTEGPSSGEKGEKGEATAGPDDDGSSATGGDTGNVTQAEAPACASGDIQEEYAQSGEPNSAGIVTGEIVMGNRSDKPCTVEGVGSVQTAATGSGNIDVAVHTDGDEASAVLPPASDAPETITLAAGETYRVAFAFVPAPEAAQQCPADGGSSPSPEPTKDAEQTTGGTGSETATGAGDTLNDPSTQLMYSDGGTGEEAPPAEETPIQITHTPEAGGETASVTVPATCVGTVYYTPPLEG